MYIYSTLKVPIFIPAGSKIAKVFRKLRLLESKHFFPFALVRRKYRTICSHNADTRHFVRLKNVFLTLDSISRFNVHLYDAIRLRYHCPSFPASHGCFSIFQIISAHYSHAFTLRAFPYVLLSTRVDKSYEGQSFYWTGEISYTNNLVNANNHVQVQAGRNSFNARFIET